MLSPFIDSYLILKKLHALHLNFMRKDSYKVIALQELQPVEANLAEEVSKRYAQKNFQLQQSIHSCRGIDEKRESFFAITNSELYILKIVSKYENNVINFTANR